MSRTKTFLHNVAASAGLQVLTMVSGIIVPRLMLVYYGSEINGLVSSIVQFISYFNIVEAGLGGAVIFSLYKPLADRNVASISNIVTAAKKLYYRTGVLFSVLVLLLAIIYPLLVSVTDMGYAHTAILVAILGANGILDFFVMAKYTTLFTADQRLYVISLANSMQVVLTTLVVYVLACQQVDIAVLRGAAAGIIFLKALAIKLYAGRHYAYVDYDSRKPDFSALSKRWDVLYLQLLNAVQTATPVVLLTVLARDLKLVSVYVVYNMVIAGVNGILGIFMNGLQAGFGEIIAKGEQETLQRAYGEFEFMYYNLIGIAYTVTFLSIQPFIRLYTEGITDIDYNVPIFAALFVVNAMLYSIKTPQGMITLAAGLYKEQRVQITVQGVIPLILGFFLVPEYGIIGVLISMIASNISRDVEIPYFVNKSLLPGSHFKTYFRMIVYLSAFAGMCFFFPENIMFIGSYFEWLVYTVLITVVSTMFFVFISVITDFTAFRGLIRRSMKIIFKDKM